MQACCPSFVSSQSECSRVAPPLCPERRRRNGRTPTCHPERRRRSRRSRRISCRLDPIATTTAASAEGDPSTPRTSCAPLRMTYGGHSFCLPHPGCDMGCAPSLTASGVTHGERPLLLSHRGCGMGGHSFCSPHRGCNMGGGRFTRCIRGATWGGRGRCIPWRRMRRVFHVKHLGQ